LGLRRRALVRRVPPRAAVRLRGGAFRVGVELRLVAIATQFDVRAQMPAHP
jgi:hypothetical protein